jgi:PhzF family phenazine biosynthesis protein
MTDILRYAAFSADPSGGNPAGVVLDQPGLSDADMLAVAASVGYSETAFLTGGGAPGTYIAVSSRARLAVLDYDVPALTALMTARDWTTITLVWRESPDSFHVRNPFPVGGVHEDPATGAAAAAFGGYLRELGLVYANAVLHLSQGDDMGRPGRLTVELRAGEHGVRVSGTAVPIPG